MIITEIRIKNFKCFKEEFRLPLCKGVNILVGNNEAGKTTIIEAINLVLTGLYQGKSVRHNLSQYLFNYDAVKEYIVSLETPNILPPPSISIELFFEDESSPAFMGDYNSKNNDKACGVRLDIHLDDKFKDEYATLVMSGLKTLPLEYYEVCWTGFARNYVIPRSIPMGCALIDSSNIKNRNNTDLLLSRIIKDYFDESDTVSITQAFRQLQESFQSNTCISKLNSKITESCNLSSKNIKLGVDMTSRSAWEEYLTPYLNDIPFVFVGKGEQAIVKTQLSLANRTAGKADIILIEEPENHLSHTKLNELIKEISEKCVDKQVIISTHSSFVANKLGLENLIFLNNRSHFRLNTLPKTTASYFKKMPGFDTLRIILCESSILVEGASDELVIQKAYMTFHNGRLPIEDGIDVISVNNLSFPRFLEIAKALRLKAVVVTDNDGDLNALREKYKPFEDCDSISICYDSQIDIRTQIDGKPFNFNTMEPIILRDNSLRVLNLILGKSYTSAEPLLKYMKANKVDCALCLFDYIGNDFVFPKYIKDAVCKWDTHE